MTDLITQSIQFRLNISLKSSRIDAQNQQAFTLHGLVIVV